MDTGAWWFTIHGVTKSWAWLSGLTYSGKSFLNTGVHGLAIRLLQKVDSEDLTSKPLLPRTAPAQSQHHALSSLS